MGRTTKRNVQLPALADPDWLSLVKKPANRTGFKVIRSEDGKPMRIRQRLKRTDQNLLSIDLPEGITREAAESLMGLFGMADEYQIVERGEDHYTLRRTNADEDGTKTVAISLGEGIIANVAPAAFARADGDPTYQVEVTREGEESYDTYTEEATGDGYTMARLVFSTTTFKTVETVREWLQGNDIDFMENGVEVRDDGIHVVRHTSEAEGYRVPIAEGVVGVLEMASKMDVPKSIHKTVLATLINPQERSDKPTTENTEMSKNEENATDNAEAVVADDAAVEQVEHLTREDVTAIVTDAITAAFAARDDAAAAESTEEVTDEPDAVATALKGIADKVEAMGTSLEAIRKDVDELGETTVARSEPEDTNEKREDDAPKSVFAGMFG